MEEFIEEIRKDNQQRVDLNASGNLDESFSRASSQANGNSSINSQLFSDNMMAENLAVSVIDKQLREKEYENHRLNENLIMVHANNKILAANIERLMQLELSEFNIQLDDGNGSSSVSDEYETEEDDANTNKEEVGFKDPIVKFTKFHRCMEEINIQHQKEMKRMKSLEHEMEKLSEENSILTRKLESVLDESDKLKQNVCKEQLKTSELLKAKEQLEITSKKYEGELKSIRAEKESVAVELEKMSENVRDLQDQVASLNNQIEHYEKVKAEITNNNASLTTQSEALQKKLEDIQAEYAGKVSWLENDIKRLNDDIAKSTSDLEKFESSERALKSNYEFVVIENERHREQFRNSEQHLRQMKYELYTKEQEMVALGNEIQLLSEKNRRLEMSFQDISTKHQKQCEELTGKQKECDKCIQMYEGKMKELKEKVQEQQRTLNLKETEAKRLENDLRYIEPIIQDLVRMCQTSIKQISDNDDEGESEEGSSSDSLISSGHVACKAVKSLNAYVKEILKQHIETMAKVETLEVTQLESNTRIQDLLADINEKNRVMQQHAENYEELLLMRSQNMEYEDRIEKLKEKQGCFIEKIKSDLQKKEEEVIERMHIASKEYEVELGNLRKELKLEIENQSNKERELLLVLAEHEDLKQKYRESEDNLLFLKKANEQLKKSYERLLDLENRVYIADEDHYNLHKEIREHLEEIDKRTEDFKDVQQMFPDILEASERFKELEITVDKLRADVTKSNASKEDTLKELLNEREAHQETINLIEELKKSLEENTSKLKRTIEENDRLTAENSRFNEKQQLLNNKNHDLEEWSESIKKVLAEKDVHIEQLEGRCETTENLLKTISERHEQLQIELSERDEEVYVQCDQQQKNLKDYQQKLYNLMNKLAEYSDKVVSNDLAIEEILKTVNTTVLQDDKLSLRLSAALDGDEAESDKSSDDVDFGGCDASSNDPKSAMIENVFNAINMKLNNGNEKDDKNINRLRSALNSWWHLMLQLQQERKQLFREHQELRCVNKDLHTARQELEMQLEAEKGELQKLREKMKLKATSPLSSPEAAKAKDHLRYLNDDDDGIHSFERLNNCLMADNSRIKELVVEYEKKLQEAMTKLEYLELENKRFVDEIREKDKRLKDESTFQEALIDLRMIYEKSEEKVNQLEDQLIKKQSKLDETEKTLQEFKEKATKSHLKFVNIQQQLKELQSEHNKLTENRNQQYTAVVKLETDVKQKAKELFALKTEHTELQEQYVKLDKELLLAQNRLKEIQDQKAHMEAEYGKLQEKHQQLVINANVLTNQQKNSNDECLRHITEMEELRNDRSLLREELKTVKADLQKAYENVSQLLQQVAAMHSEKDVTMEENKSLKLQVSEVEKARSELSENVRVQSEHNQNLEQKLLKAENDLRMVRISDEKNSQSLCKLSQENLKLKSSNETATKRIEKMALRLGDFQARCSKFERDNEKLSKSLETNIAMMESLQSEKELLQSDAKVLKERLSRAETGHEQLVSKVQNLENRNELLQASKQKLEFQQTESSKKIQKLEKLRDNCEEQLRKWEFDHSNSEKQRVKLLLEVGGLNSQLKELEVKAEHTTSVQSQRIEELTADLVKTKEEAGNCLKLNEELKNELNGIQSENERMKQRLEKSERDAGVHERNYEQLNCDISKLRTELLILREEKVQIERDREVMKQQWKEAEAERDQMEQKYNDVVKLEERFADTESQLHVSCRDVDALGKEIHDLKKNNSSYMSIIKKSSELSAAEFNALREQLSEADRVLKSEQETSGALKSENELLQTKYREIKQKILEITEASEEKIKQNRLEMESKLERMKAKMVSTSYRVRFMVVLVYDCHCSGVVFHLQPDFILANPPFPLNMVSSSSKGT